MFTNEWANIVLAGLCIGLLVSIPLGAVSMQAAYRWADRNYRDAYAMAAGVFIGDLFVAITVMKLLQAGIVEVKWQFMLSGAVLMFVMSWVIKQNQRLIEGARGIPVCMVMGFVVTVIQPGNYGTYILSYGGQFMSVQYLFGVPNVIGMPWQQVALLIGMNCMGLIVGWTGYYWGIATWGMAFKKTFSMLTAPLVALAGVITLGELGWNYRSSLASVWWWLV